MIKFIAILLFSSLIVWGAADCSQFSNDCEYYTCVAQSRHCTSKSYPINFGRKYCLRYNQSFQKFSSNGKRWIQDVRRCLIQKMESYDSELTCHELKIRAFKDHIPCYIDHGYCELSNQDKIEIIKTVLPSLRHLRVLYSGAELSLACKYRK